MAEQQAVAFAWNDAQIGREIEVLIDAAVPNQPNAVVGRSYADAPEIDGAVYVTGSGLEPGMMVRAEVVARKDYDLIAVAVGEPY